MRLVPVLALLVAGCGNLTDLGECAESTREWWPVQKGARWTYRVTDRREILTGAGGAAPKVDWKEQEIDTDLEEIGGLAGGQEGFRMRVTDPLDKEWDWSWHVEQDDAYLWRRKLYFDVGSDEPTRDAVYEPARTRLDYSADRVCLGSSWHEEFEQIDIYTSLFDDSTVSKCPSSTWQEDPWSCPLDVSPNGSTWTVVAVDATVVLLGGQAFYEHCLCMRRRDDEGLKDSTYCYARGVGKVFECERLAGEPSKIEELCRSCVPPEECDPTEEVPPSCTDGQWEGSCDDVFLR